MQNCLQKCFWQAREILKQRKIGIKNKDGENINETLVSAYDLDIVPNDLSYINKQSAGYSEKVLVKVLRQNETFSIVNNYTDEELQELGFSEDEISDMKELKLHDEIILH